MNGLLHTEFQVLLRRSYTSQARFARLTGYTVQQVNAWCRGRTPAPLWAITLALLLQKVPIWEAERLTATFEWFETLGVSPTSPQDEVRKAMAVMTKLHHPDRDGGCLNLMQRAANAYNKSKTKA